MTRVELRNHIAATTGCSYSTAGSLIDWMATEHLIALAPEDHQPLVPHPGPSTGSPPWHDATTDPAPDNIFCWVLNSAPIGQTVYLAIHDHDQPYNCWRMASYAGADKANVGLYSGVVAWRPLDDPPAIPTKIVEWR